MAKFKSTKRRYFLSLGVRFAAFSDGVFRTDDNSLAELLRKHPAFGSDFSEVDDDNTPTYETEKETIVIPSIEPEPESEYLPKAKTKRPKKKGKR